MKSKKKFTSRKKRGLRQRKKDHSDDDDTNADQDGFDSIYVDEAERKDFDSMRLDAATVGKKKSGGFQSMGLSPPILKGVLKRGYQIPTPIQRKASSIFFKPLS
ncbi:unnamed protein product [Ixodes pacificus]